MAILLIFGRREYSRKKYAFKVLDRAAETLDIELVIAGEARGADAIGKLWALARNIPYKGFKANWYKYGNGAGPKRNQQMIDKGHPTNSVAFWMGKKNDIGGTADMARRCKFHKIPVWDIEK